MILYCMGYFLRKKYYSHKFSIKHRLSSNDGKGDVEIENNIAYGSTSTSRITQDALYEDVQPNK